MFLSLYSHAVLNANARCFGPGTVYYALQVAFIPIVDNPEWKTLTRVLLAMCAVIRVIGFIVFAVEANNYTAVYFAIYPAIHALIADAIIYSFFML